ncbi:MAG: CpsD/CapB family tyrosine-protein kinase [Bdellovibrionales bacterium]
MDKLEKALQKARALRETTVSVPSTKSLEAKGGPSNLSGVPVGTISMSEDVLEENRVLAHRLRSYEADLFRLLRTQVLQTMGNHHFNTLAITSPNYGEGKTTIALNLAVSIALDLKQTVLLVDLDLRKPSLHRYLGLNPELGLTDYLAGRNELSECLLRLPFERLTTLPAGRQLEQSSELLGSPQMSALAAELKSRYPDRMVIYDMPPLLAQDDPLTFLPHVDAFLLVVQDGVTRAQDVKRSMDILSQANVIGTVLNNRERFPFFDKS